MDKQTKEQCLKQDDFQRSSFSKVVGPAARPPRTKRGGLELRGRQLVQSAWENVTVRKRGKEARAPMHVYFPPKRWEANGCQRRVEGHEDLVKDTISQGVGVRRGNALTSVARDTPTPPALRQLEDQRFPPASQIS